MVTADANPMSSGTVLIIRATGVGFEGSNWPRDGETERPASDDAEPKGKPENPPSPPRTGEDDKLLVRPGEEGNDMVTTVSDALLLLDAVPGEGMADMAPDDGEPNANALL